MKPSVQNVYLTLILTLIFSACGTQNLNSEQDQNAKKGVSISKAAAEAALTECMTPVLREIFEKQIGTGFNAIETNEPHQKLFVGCSFSPSIAASEPLTWQCSRAICVSEFEAGLSKCDAFSAPDFKGYFVTIGNYGAVAKTGLKIEIQTQGEPNRIEFQSGEAQVEFFGNAMLPFQEDSKIENFEFETTDNPKARFEARENDSGPIEPLNAASLHECFSAKVQIAPKLH